MPQRFIQIPEDVKVKLPGREGDLEVPMSFGKDFVKGLLDNNPIWSKNFKNVRAALAIEAALKDKVPGNWMSIAQEDWELLKESVEKPQLPGAQGSQEGFPFIPQAIRQMYPFMEAIVNATDKEPSLT